MEFVSIPNCEGYFINRQGEILSKCKYKDGRIMKHCIHNQGYYKVQFRINKQAKTFLVHRLLAITFIPNPNNYKFVDHKNRDRKDNRLENLNWVTHEMNNQNQSKSKRNTSGYKQIYWLTKNQRWCVEIKRNKKYVCNNTFKKLEDAISHRNKILTDLGEEII